MNIIISVNFVIIFCKASEISVVPLECIISFILLGASNEAPKMTNVLNLFTMSRLHLDSLFD